MAIHQLDFAPWRLSGVVLGPLLNDPAALALMGDAVHAAPYQTPPVAPVLFIKPRNTWVSAGEQGAEISVPAGEAEYELAACLALVVARSACKVSETQAMDFVAGWTLVADFSLPHSSAYRPSVRFKARDGSCLIGPRVVPRQVISDPAARVLQVKVDGKVVQTVHLATMQRRAARLLQDISEFMTLGAGDLLMLGSAVGAPRARAGQRVAIACDGIGELQACLVAESPEAAAA